MRRDAIQKKKIHVGIVYGGKSGEHEVSLVSARSVVGALDIRRYQAIPFFIDKKGNGFDALVKYRARIDVVFPLIHGTGGEDGSLQGFLETFNIPYVGCGTSASAVCMDKIMQKQITGSIGIPNVSFGVLRAIECKKYRSNILRHLKHRQAIWQGDDAPKFPLFVKPANLGSSVGISKAHNQKELRDALYYALRYDNRVIIENAVLAAREIECAVLGNEEPRTSVCGEVVPSNEFYDYDAKYINDKSCLQIPAKLNTAVHKSITDAAKKAFIAMGCSGMARVDFLMSKTTGKIYLNELNTIPGFTSISMFPKLWEASGLRYSELLDKLIALAFDRHKNRSRLLYSYQPKKKWW